MTEGLDRLYSVYEVADHLNVNPQTVRIWLREGQIKGRKIGKSWKVRHDDLRDYITQKFGITEPESGRTEVAQLSFDDVGGDE